MPAVSTRTAPRNSGTDIGRREFISLLGAGAAASVGLTGTTQAQSAPVVTMDGDHFDPVGLHVEPGTTVRFEIESGSHTVSAYQARIPAEADVFDSGRLSDGAFEHTFDTPGTYDYYCRPHRSSGMVGRIVVGEPGGPAEASHIPDGAVPDSETIVDQGTVGIHEADDTEADSADERNHGGMGMSGPGGMGWMLLMPIGFLVVVLGLIGSVTYWAFSRVTDASSWPDSAIAVLERQYARGELDDEEYQRRRDELDTND